MCNAFFKCFSQLNCARRSPGAAIIDGFIYVCGGGTGDNLLNSVEVYDPTIKKWTIFSTLPEPLSQISVMAQNYNLLLCGGWNTLDSRKTVWKLNVKSGILSKHSTMKQGRFGFAVVQFKRCLIAVGGFLKMNMATTATEVFDGHKWTKGPPLPVPIGGYGSVILTKELEDFFVNRFA